MNQNTNLLKTRQLAPTMGTMASLNSRMRERIKEAKNKKKLSERDLAGFCGWSQSKISQKLAGVSAMTLDEFEALCQAVGLTLVEAVRQRGLEFFAELTPSELTLVERLRSFPPPVLQSVNLLLNIRESEIERRGLTPKTSLYGRPRSKS